MKKNMGKTDKIIRLLLAAIFIGLFITDTVVGTAGIVLVILAGIFIVTSVVSFCPMYSFFGANTCNKNTNETAIK
jgi:hypothetical protein